MKTTLIALLFFSLSACGMLLLTAELKVTTFDEESQPLPNTEVTAWFPHIYGVGASPKGETFQVLTNPDGQVVFRGKTAGPVSFGARKTGFYETAGGRIDFVAMHNRGEDAVAESELVLKAIRNPIPMYRKAVEGNEVACTEHTVWL